MHPSFTHLPVISMGSETPPGARLVVALAILLGACASAVDDASSVVTPVDGSVERDARPGALDAELEPALDAEGGRDAEPDAAEPGQDAEPDAEHDAAPPRDARLDPDAAPDPDCVEGTACNPIPIDTLPFAHAGDTTTAPAAAWDFYGCAPDTDESGGEVVYVLDLEEPGTLSVAVDDAAGDGRDVDVHLLDALDPDACLARDNVRLDRPVEPGRYYIVVDTWVNAAGEALPGPYRLDVSLRRQAVGDCAMRDEAVRMAWRACDPSLDCFEAEDDNGNLARFLQTPAIGPVVKEAHLVTVDDVFPGGWPSALRDGIDAHYRLSQAATGYVMDRREPWAPEGEGGSRWGQSAYSRPLPVVEEAFYVNMYWSPRPAPSTRLIVRNPANGRAVVAAGGFETGPGANTAIGGVSEEIHHHLGTNHRSVLQLGFAVDQTLPFGPIECGD